MQCSLLEQIKAMDPIDLSEMDNVRLMNRVDTKYLFREDELPGLLEAVTADYRALSVAGTRLSPYSTLYFDGYDHECFLQHHNGKLNRFKLRQREYVTTGACFLEVKRKNSKGRTDKHRIPVDANGGMLTEEAKEFLTSLFGTLPKFVPQLWTEFSRLTLVHRHEEERVTLDCDLSFRSGDHKQNLAGLVIAEVKQTRDNRSSPIRMQLQQREIRPFRISKYCLGSVLLKPQLKYNRFKPKLQAIRKILPEKGMHGIP